MPFVKNSFSWSIGIQLCLKQVMVARIYASHLRVWQTQLSNIASSCFDIDKTLLNQYDISSITAARVKSYNMSVTVKILERKK